MNQVRVHKHAGATVRCNEVQEETIHRLVEEGELRGPDVDVFYEPGSRPAVLAEDRAGGRYLIFEDGSALRRP